MRTAPGLAPVALFALALSFTGVGCPCVDDTINSNYLIYGRPVYAMAGGTVVGCWRNAPENTGHTKRPEIATGKILLQGNHIWIKQTDGNIALYAHAPTGDIPASLRSSVDAFIEKGNSAAVLLFEGLGRTK